jgi:hypothetical protein
VGLRTFHVFPSDGAWVVKRNGRSGESFPTRGEAVKAARENAKAEKAGQVVVFGRNGNIKDRWAHGMPRFDGPFRKSPRARDIARAVAQVIFARVVAQWQLERSPQ